MVLSVTRFHDISCGHRVVGHEGKCRGLHGHNYRIHFECIGPLDDIGRVIDFSVIKSELCNWLEDVWDHKMLLWSKDPVAAMQYQRRYNGPEQDDQELYDAMNSIVQVPFNPTAENMAKFLLDLSDIRLEGTGVTCVKVIVEETRKCLATASREI